MSSSEETLSYGGVFERIAELAEELLEYPDRDLAAKIEELLDWVDAFHRDGLGQLVDMIRSWRGEIFLESVARDPIAGTVLDAYGLGESKEAKVEADDAVTAALESVRPLVESHGGAIEVDSVVDGVVTVRMLGTCDGCPSSSATLTYGVEAALRENWPNFRRLEVVDAPAEVDPSKADLTCVSAPDAPESPRIASAPVAAPAAEPQPVLLQIRGHEGE